MGERLRDRRRGGAGRARVRAAAVAVPVLAALLAGCVRMPQQVPVPEAAPAKPALTRAEGAAIVADYDRRNTLAIAEVARTRRADAWKTVDAGMILAYDQFEVAFTRAAKRRFSTSVGSLTAGVVFSGAATRYPRAVLVESSWKPASRTERSWLRTHTSIDLYTRSSVAAPWLQRATATLRRSDLPKPAADSRVVAPAQLKAAQRACDGVRDDLPTGRARRVPVTPVLRDIAAAWTSHAAWELRPQMWVDYWAPAARSQTGPGGSITVLPVDQGAIAFCELAVRMTYRSKRGTISWRSKAYAAATGQRGQRSALTKRFGLGVVVLVVTGQRSRAIGAGLHEVHPGSGS